MLIEAAEVVGLLILSDYVSEAEGYEDTYEYRNPNPPLYNQFGGCESGYNCDNGVKSISVTTRFDQAERDAEAIAGYLNNAYDTISTAVSNDFNNNKDMYATSIGAAAGGAVAGAIYGTAGGPGGIVAGAAAGAAGAFEGAIGAGGIAHVGQVTTKFVKGFFDDKDKD